MKEFKIEGERSFWGDKCGDRYRKRAKTDRKPVIADLLEHHQRLLEEPLLPATGKRPVVGVPRAMFFYDRFPFWCAYFQKLGFDVVLSPPTDKQYFRARRRVGNRAAVFPGQSGAWARSGTALKKC